MGYLLHTFCTFFAPDGSPHSGLLEGTPVYQMHGNIPLYSIMHVIHKLFTATHCAAILSVCNKKEAV